jgi:ubiquinone/menaquinone biosynthesis C-methylase UbiE
VAKADTVFSGSIPALYDKYLGPLIFEPYAEDLAQRLSALDAARVLEAAAGTGIVTRALLHALPGSVAIVATDLNQPMVDHAAAQVSSSRVTWQKADAQSLPFPDGVFDAVVCQFGVMFFPDKRQAYREARRVLKPGGRFIFNVWDKLNTTSSPPWLLRRRSMSFPTILRFFWQERRTGITTSKRSSPMFAAPASSMLRRKP